ncbi:MAG: hypothetical protein ACTSX7_20735 [Alphaproteobacteria bacterium]
MAKLQPLFASRPRIGAFNGFVLAGGLVNVVIVTILVIHWIVQ